MDAWLGFNQPKSVAKSWLRLKSKCKISQYPNNFMPSIELNFGEEIIVDRRFPKNKKDEICNEFENQFQFFIRLF